MDESPSCGEDVHEQLLVLFQDSGSVKCAGVGSFRLRQRYTHTTKVSLSLVLIGIIGPSSEVEKPSELVLKGSSTTSKRLHFHHLTCIRNSALSSGLRSPSTTFPQYSPLSSMIKAHLFRYSDIK